MYSLGPGRRYTHQLQHSSSNLPSFIKEATYVFASSAVRPPCNSAAFAIAAFTAVGILFEDLPLYEFFW